MVETPTEELLRARIAFLEVWHQAAEAKHAEVTAILALEQEWHAQALDGADKLRKEAEMLRLKLAKRGCCKVDGGEDGGEGR